MRVLVPSLPLLILLAVAAPPTAYAAGAGGSDIVYPTDDPDIPSVRAKIQAKNYSGALADLRSMKPSADVYNLMGFSLRKSGDYKQAYIYYRKALDLDPRHKGALEYLGELYVETGQIDKARENVALLKQLCPRGCEELEDLEKAIAQPPPRRS